MVTEMDENQEAYLDMADRADEILGLGIKDWDEERRLWLGQQLLKAAALTEMACGRTA